MESGSFETRFTMIASWQMLQSKYFIILIYILAIDSGELGDKLLR
jgi:hypothetical protein